MFKKFFAFTVSIIIPFIFFSCSSPSGGGSGFTITENLPDVYIRGVDYTIIIKDFVSDISVTKTQSGSSVVFTAEDCDSCDWTFEEKSVGTGAICLLDTSSLLAGTYSLSLEAEKNGKRYSYYAQIKVVN